MIEESDRGVRITDELIRKCQAGNPQFYEARVRVYAADRRDE
jgi:hypothetical protein